MQEPDRQVEIQLGHMCNNRCVFCVSGQRTAMREALPMPLAPIEARIEAAYEAGHRKITLLGGEPTLQPHFLSAVRRGVRGGRQSGRHGARLGGGLGWRAGGSRG